MKNIMEVINSVFQRNLYQPLTPEFLYNLEREIADELLSIFPDIKEKVRVEDEHISIHGEYQQQDVEVLYAVPYLFEIEKYKTYEVYCGFTIVGTVLFCGSEIRESDGVVRNNYSINGDVLLQHWYSRKRGVPVAE